MTGSDNPLHLRIAAREIFDEALKAVDAGDAVRRVVRPDGLKIGEATLSLTPRQPIYTIAMGKAAISMASGLDEAIGAGITLGLISGNAPANPIRVLPPRWQVFAGGHPEPNEQSLAAAQACFALLKRADEERALVIFLISGGGSAMIEWPLVDSITLEDLRVANRVLVNCGASIREMNAVRRAFSAVKGGRLAACAPHCDQVSLIVSDVPQGEEENVASGPTIVPSGNSPAAGEVIARYYLRGQLPAALLRAVDADPNVARRFAGDPRARREHCVILSNGTALHAAAVAARRRAFITELATEITDQPIENGCAQLLSRLEALGKQAEIKESTACLISGGEFACPLTGDGIGGRSLETALRLAIDYDKQSATSKRPFVALCAGTDGIDGNSPAAGAIVDHTTTGRARGVGLDPKEFLRRSDAYSFFVALGDVFTTGPTGTNVRDVRILLATA